MPPVHPAHDANVIPASSSSIAYISNLSPPPTLLVQINGVHYHFVTVEEFERGIAEGKFIEYAKVHTNYYGTTFESVHSARSKGHIVLLELDIQGVRTVREKTRVTPDQGLECTYIFIWPPNEEELYVRLRGRGSDSEEIIKTRLQTAREELDAAKNEPHLFDFTLVNEDLDRCYIELNQIIAKLFPHLADRAKTVCERIAAKKSQEANGANATSPNSK